MWSFWNYVYVYDLSSVVLTYRGIVKPFGNTNAGYGLLPNASKPLPETMLNFH